MKGYYMYTVHVNCISYSWIFCMQLIFACFHSQAETGKVTPATGNYISPLCELFHSPLVAKFRSMKNIANKKVHQNTYQFHKKIPAIQYVLWIIFNILFTHPMLAFQHPFNIFTSPMLAFQHPFNILFTCPTLALLDQCVKTSNYLLQVYMCIMELGGSLKTSLKENNFCRCSNQMLQPEDDQGIWSKHQQKLFSFKPVFREPPSSIILEPAENGSLHSYLREHYSSSTQRLARDHERSLHKRARHVYTLQILCIETKQKQRQQVLLCILLW